MYARWTKSVSIPYWNRMKWIALHSLRTHEKTKNKKEKRQKKTEPKVKNFKRWRNGVCNDKCRRWLQLDTGALRLWINRFGADSAVSRTSFCRREHFFQRRQLCRRLRWWSKDDSRVYYSPYIRASVGRFLSSSRTKWSITKKKLKWNK